MTSARPWISWIVLSLVTAPCLASHAAGCRHPVAMAFSADRGQLFVANERAGTVSIVDTRKGRVTDEVALGGRLSDVVLLPHSDLIVAADLEHHQLVVLGPEARGLRLIARWPLICDPIDLAASSDGRRLYVAGLWSRACAVYTRSNPVHRLPHGGLVLEAKIDLPFPPHRMILLESAQKLVITSAFKAKLAVVDLVSNQLESVRPLNGHNIRGLAFDTPRGCLWVSHQLLDESATTLRGDIQWGSLMVNLVRSIPLSSLLDPAADLDQTSVIHTLASAGDGAGDPAALSVTDNGTLAVAIAGLGDLALLDPKSGAIRRLGIGKRPTALTYDPSTDTLYVANTFSDSIAVMDAGRRWFKQRIRLSPRRSHDLPLVDQGEHLFYDASLSFHGWFSCHSCHTDGHTNGLLNDNHGDGSFGTPKLVPSLLGAAQTGPWGWLGVRDDLGAQVRQSIHSTMQGIPTARQVKALTAFLGTLEPPATVQPESASQISRGDRLFHRLHCRRCHRPPLYTSAGTYDTGIPDEAGAGAFNPPSLRAVALRQRWLHNGSAPTLAAAIQRHLRAKKTDLTQDNLNDLTAFLQSL